MHPDTKSAPLLLQTQNPSRNSIQGKYHIGPDALIAIAKSANVSEGDKKYTGLLRPEPHVFGGGPALVFEIAKSFVAECTVRVYLAASNQTGEFVKIRREYKCLPILERSDKPPVFLYEFVEAIDGALNYEELRNEFPGLSYSQISGALGFLRRISQFNTVGLDLDELEEEYIEGNPEFQEKILHDLSSEERLRVLNP